MRTTLLRLEGLLGCLRANVLHHHIEGAWDHLPEPAGRGRLDTDTMRKCRIAWIELSMFPKAVLRTSKRGLKPEQALAQSRSRLERWGANKHSR